MENLLDFVLYFFIYSIIGYIVEVTVCSIGQKKLVNRGFLFGPLLPIYGFGMVAVILATESVKDNTWLTFLIAMLTCSILEYFTSWLLEKLFHIKWWDYSKSDRLNLNGRICLRNCLAFGIGGCFVVEALHPHIASFVDSLKSLQPALSIILLALLALDFFASTYAVEKIKHNVKLRLITGDQTNEVKKLARRAVAQLITKKDYFERRLDQLKRDFEQHQKALEKEQKQKLLELKKKFKEL